VLQIDTHDPTAPDEVDPWLLTNDCWTWCFCPLADEAAVPDSAKMSYSRASTVPFTLYVLILVAVAWAEWEEEWHEQAACSQFSAYSVSVFEERVSPWETWAPWLDPVKTACPRLGWIPPTPGGTVHEHVAAVC
jgi:hypothetical protein